MAGDGRRRDGEWQQVYAEEVDRAREAHRKGLGELEYREDGWWWRSIPAVEKKGFERRADGTYVTNFRQCECGEQYLPGANHERTSPRHREWLKGNIEVPVPEQPLVAAYDRGQRPALILGETMICPRCKSRRSRAKWAQGLDYITDVRATESYQIPCMRCNGHGVVPNVGPA